MNIVNEENGKISYFNFVKLMFLIALLLVPLIRNNMIEIKHFYIIDYIALPLILVNLDLYINRCLLINKFQKYLKKILNITLLFTKYNYKIFIPLKLNNNLMPLNNIYKKIYSKKNIENCVFRIWKTP